MIISKWTLNSNDIETQSDRSFTYSILERHVQDDDEIRSIGQVAENQIGYSTN